MPASFHNEWLLNCSEVLKTDSREEQAGREPSVERTLCVKLECDVQPVVFWQDYSERCSHHF